MAKQAATKRLGRGLSSLISEPVAVEAEPVTPPHVAINKLVTSDLAASPGGITHVPIDQIIPNRYQPRKAFTEDSLQRLADSVRVSGVIQPVIVRPVTGSDGAHDGAKWELIAGERRWRAAKLAGLSTLPAVIHEVSDRVTAEWALVENLQREDLNAVERAQALKELRDEFGLTQSQVAEQVGLDRATVSNLIRLTELEPAILDMLREGTLSAGHGKALLSVDDPSRRLVLARRAAKDGWSVRRTEREAAGATSPTPPPARAPERSASIESLEKELGDYFGAKLSIKQNTNKKSGAITIRYFDLDHFESILERMRFRGE